MGLLFLKEFTQEMRPCLLSLNNTVLFIISISPSNSLVFTASFFKHVTISKEHIYTYTQGGKDG